MKNFNQYILEKLSTPDIIIDFIKTKKDLISNKIKLNEDLNLTINDKILIRNKTIKFDVNIFIHLIRNSDNYGGNVDQNKCINSEFKECNINLNIPDNYDINKIFKTLSHELTHIYELYQIKNIFDNIKKWKINFNLFDDIYDEQEILMYFRYLLYTSLYQEINSKVASTSIYLRQLRTNDINILMNELKKSTEWKHYESLYNFEPNKYFKDILEKYDEDFVFATFNYLNKIMSIKTIINNKEELLNYFKNTKRYFRKICKIYKTKLFKIVHDVSIYKFENNEYLFEYFGKIEYSNRDSNLEILLYPDYKDYFN